MKSIKIQETNGLYDIVLDESFKPIMLTGYDELLQRMRIKLNTQLGEWFGNTKMGVDFVNILGFKNKDETLKFAIEAIILGFDEVKEITEFECTLDTDRNFKGTLKFTLTDESKLELKVGDN